MFKINFIFGLRSSNSNLKNVQLFKKGVKYFADKPKLRKDYYQILGIPKTATEEEIKKAYRNLAKKYRPM